MELDRTGGQFKLTTFFHPLEANRALVEALSSRLMGLLLEFACRRFNLDLHGACAIGAMFSAALVGKFSQYRSCYSGATTFR